ncbi:hypothetical protein [Glaciibacter psychrotolerans]|uniref:Tfp pilus assembly protein PilO n=1 Tax=Glaciibacter psychrotolerans TaxID=670054 RepID=A0A7Z0J7I8_9MICO|nr:hypothetical protein [Leifsonia psychrotolerans]NYJ21530.1 Tfp pilus assembly protein PilO [Leifsonia psychrotolerans]
MKSNRIWVLGSVVIMVVVLMVGWSFGVQPQLAATALANEDRAFASDQNVQHEITLVKLKKDFEGIDALKAERNTLMVSVPRLVEAPRFLNELDALAAANGVTLTGVTLDQPEAYLSTVPTTSPDAEGAEAGSSSGEAVAPATPAVSEVGAPPVTDPLITPTSMASLAVEVTIRGSYDQILSFVNGLQTQGRLVMVTGLETSIDPVTPDVVEAAIRGFIYALPGASVPLPPEAAAG